MGRGLSRLSGELTGTTAPANPTRAWFEPGVIKSVVTGYSSEPIVTVTWRDVDVPCSFLSTYSPSSGDVVLLLIQPPSVVVLGRLIGATTEEETA